MSTATLAIHGGQKTRTKPFTLRTTILKEDIDAAVAVLQSGDISMFFGSPGEFFLGGPRVKEFEKKWADRYGFKHAITVNSWTTGLMACVGALGIEPGDEVLCTPYSMSATATSILFYGGIPVFVDIEEKTFNIDPKKIETKITPRTKAIMLVHLFGHPAAMDEIIAIAKKHNLKIIEDGAHAPGAKYKGKYVGALSDLGGFSFNYHKHIHAGEGGLIVT
ncbi:MAG: aminotransferase class I/II-fold pyridoxal phosphate-dependent enzyme, partial [Bdellovibrionota bacterium]